MKKYSIGRFSGLALILLMSACSGGGDGAPISVDTSSASGNQISSQASGAAADTKTFRFSGVAGFETGLVKLAEIDGRITARDEVTVNWGDRVETGALFASCAIARPRTNCEIWGTHKYAQAGNYTVRVTYTINKVLPRNEAPETVTTTATIDPVSDFVVVAVGDSYYSGEGSPLHAAATDLGDTALWDEPSINYFSGNIGPAVDGNGNEYESGDELYTCHRSALSGPRIAARTLLSEGNPITFVNMPCSGAKLGNGFRFETAGGQTVRDTGSFINEQLDWVRTRVPRIDALLVSAGGNNVGFADTITACLCIGLENGNDACPVLESKGFCADDPAVQSGLDEDFRILNGSSAGQDPDGNLLYTKGEYDLFAEDIQCRSVDGRNPTLGVLCADIQFRPNTELLADGIAVPLLDASYQSQSGKTVLTQNGTLRSSGGCHNFVLDVSDLSQPTITLRKVDKTDDSCGVFETAFSKSEPYGEPLFVRGSFDDWLRVPNWAQRFVNIGDGTLQAEFVLPGPVDVEETWNLKIASAKEFQVPGVTVVNHYPDVTRNDDGLTPTAAETLACTGFAIAPSEWDYLKRELVDRLFESIETKAALYDWKTLRVDEFLTRGYCTNIVRRWMVRVAQSLVWQGDVSGSAHPNWDGHEYYGRVIRTGVINHSPPRTIATAETNGNNYEFGSVTNKDVTFSLSADLPLVASGVNTTYFSIGEPRCTSESINDSACTQYQGPVTISDGGIHTLSFFSTSVTGAAETRVWPETIVIDKDPPVMTCDPSPVSVWPPNGKLVLIDIDVTAIDAVSGPADFLLVAIGDSQDNANEDVVDFEIDTADTNGSVRSRRDGNGPGRTYTLTYESSDPFGNTASCEAEIVVPHDQRPG